MEGESEGDEEKEHKPLVKEMHEGLWLGFLRVGRERCLSFDGLVILFLEELELCN